MGGDFSLNPDLLRQGVDQARRREVLQIMQAALDAADPVNAVRRYVMREGDVLHIGGRMYDLARYRRVLAVGAGKASGAMAQAVEEILGERLTAGWVNVKDGYMAPTRRVHIHEAGHPLPDARGVAGARQIATLLRQAGEEDLVLCLISGGGSALMTLPVEGVTLADMQALTTALLRCGATINEINAVRKHLSQVKGGNLARLAYPATIVSLIVSDVVGSPLDVIASGPTVPDTATYADAFAVLEKYDLLDQVPASIAAHLRAGVESKLPETPKADDIAFTKTHNVIIADNAIAAQEAIEKAKALGFQTMLLSTYVEGEAREVAKVIAAIAKEVASTGRPLARPACLVAGGETTVTVRGNGKGGRNQEMALAAALQIEGLDDVMIIGLATDGTDGPTDAAGAIAEGRTLSWAWEKGLDPRAYLANNDAYHFFRAVGDLLVTGPTNTNVNDLTFLFVF